MTTFIGYVASSIDGRISVDNSKQPEWTSSEDWDFFQSELEKADAVVSGHNTYKAVKERMDKRNSFVFTTSVDKPIKEGSVTKLNPGKTDLKELLNSYERVAIVGGASVYGYMLENGMMNELYVTVEPLILGHGIPMFENVTRSYDMNLVETKKLNENGTLLMHYHVS